MKDVQRLRDQAQNQAQQENYFKNLNELVGELYINLQKIKMASSSVGFSISSDMHDSLNEAFETIQKSYEGDYIDEDLLKQARLILKNKTVNNLSKEWTEYYKRITKNINGTLNNIGDLIADKNKLVIIRQNINNGAQWSALGLTDVNQQDRLTNLKNALDEASDIIANLNLKDDITFFLRKVSKKEADIDDLSEEIVEWIKKENLTDRFTIVFKE